jgi:hypothetical protein
MPCLLCVTHECIEIAANSTRCQEDRRDELCNALTTRVMLAGDDTSSLDVRHHHNIVFAVLQAYCMHSTTKETAPASDIATPLYTVMCNTIIVDRAALSEHIEICLMEATRVQISNSGHQDLFVAALMKLIAYTRAQQLGFTATTVMRPIIQALVVN